MRGSSTNECTRGPQIAARRAASWRTNRSWIESQSQDSRNPIRWHKMMTTRATRRSTKPIVGRAIMHGSNRIRNSWKIKKIIRPGQWEKRKIETGQKRQEEGWQEERLAGLQEEWKMRTLLSHNGVRRTMEINLKESKILGI